MIGGGELTRWCEQVGGGTREFMEAAGPEQWLIYEPAMLPEIDLAALVNPMEGAVIDIPPEEQRKQASSVQLPMHRRMDMQRIVMQQDAPLPPKSIPERPDAAHAMVRAASPLSAMQGLPTADPGKTGPSPILIQSPSPALAHIDASSSTVFFENLTSAVEDILSTLTNDTSSMESRGETTSHPVTLEQIAGELHFHPSVTAHTTLTESTSSSSSSNAVSQSASEILTETVERLIETLQTFTPHAMPESLLPIPATHPNAANFEALSTAARAPRPIRPSPTPTEPMDPTVRWLEDDDLAAGLQRILQRQARRKGIDLA